jgi:hypothetical protein
MVKIELTKVDYVRKPGTKTAWLETERVVEDCTEREHRLATSDDTLKWFRRLGASESVTRAYTCAGYVPVRVVSTSPDKTMRTIREYKFTWNEKN